MCAINCCYLIVLFGWMIQERARFWPITWILFPPPFNENALFLPLCCCLYFFIILQGAVLPEANCWKFLLSQDRITSNSSVSKWLKCVYRFTLLLIPVTCLCKLFKIYCYVPSTYYCNQLFMLFHSGPGLKEKKVKLEQLLKETTYSLEDLQGSS